MSDINDIILLLPYKRHPATAYKTKIDILEFTYSHNLNKEQYLAWRPSIRITDIIGSQRYLFADAESRH